MQQLHRMLRVLPAVIEPRLGERLPQRQQLLRRGECGGGWGLRAARTGRVQAWQGAAAAAGAGSRLGATLGGARQLLAHRPLGWAVEHHAVAALCRVVVQQQHHLLPKALVPQHRVRGGCGHEQAAHLWRARDVGPHLLLRQPRVLQGQKLHVCRRLARGPRLGRAAAGGHEPRPVRPPVAQHLGWGVVLVGGGAARLGPLRLQAPAAAAAAGAAPDAAAGAATPAAWGCSRAAEHRCCSWATHRASQLPPHPAIAPPLRAQVVGGSRERGWWAGRGVS